MKYNSCIETPLKNRRKLDIGDEIAFEKDPKNRYIISQILYPKKSSPDHSFAEYWQKNIDISHPKLLWLSSISKIKKNKNLKIIVE